MVGVDHDDVGPAAHLEVAGVDAEVVGDLAGEAVDGALAGHEGAALGLGVDHQAQQVQREVVVRHVPQVGAGVGEPDQHRGVVDDVLQLLEPVVADDRVPAEVVAELGLQVEEAVERLDAALGGHRRRTTGR